MSETKPQAERLVSAQVGVLGAMLIDCDCVADVLARTGRSGSYFRQPSRSTL